MRSSSVARQQEDTIGYKLGKRYSHRPPSSEVKGAIIFWAEQGMICIEDERLPDRDPKHFIVLSVREWLQNLRGINAQVHREKYPDERENLHKLIEEGIACAKTARMQGDPLNPEHVRDMLLQRRKSMLLAGLANQFKPGALSTSYAPEAAELPPLPRGTKIVSME